MREILEQIARLEAEALAVHTLLCRAQRSVKRLTQFNRPVTHQTRQYLADYNVRLDALCLELKTLCQRRDLPRLLDDCERNLGSVRRRIRQQARRRRFDPNLLEREQQLIRQRNRLEYLDEQEALKAWDEYIEEQSASADNDENVLVLNAVEDDFPLDSVDEDDPDATRVGFSPFDIRPEHRLSGWGIGLREAVADTLAESLPCLRGSTMSPRAVPLSV